VSTTTDSLGLTTAIASLVLLVIMVLVAIVFQAQSFYQVRQLGKKVAYAPARAGASETPHEATGPALRSRQYQELDAVSDM
jgi:uncharacterized membrane protein YqjE